MDRTPECNYRYSSKTYQSTTTTLSINRHHRCTCQRSWMNLISGHSTPSKSRSPSKSEIVRHFSLLSYADHCLTLADSLSKWLCQDCRNLVITSRQVFNLSYSVATARDQHAPVRMRCASHPPGPIVFGHFDGHPRSAWNDTCPNRFQPTTLSTGELAAAADDVDYSYRTLLCIGEQFRGYYPK